MEIPQEKALMVMGHERIAMSDFLMILEKSLGIVNLACQTAGISRGTYYAWRHKDEWFAEVSDQVIAESKPVLHDLAKHGLIKKIMAGDNACIIFYLKTCHPEFKERLAKKEDGIIEAVLGKNNPNLVETIKAINQTLDDQDWTEEWQGKKIIEN